MKTLITQREVRGRYVIRVTTPSGRIYYGDSAHQLTMEEIAYNWKYKRRQCFTHQNGK